MKSDQSDVKAKVSSSDFDERAEYEETADSGSGFGDEKFEESVGFTSMRIEPKGPDSEKQDSESDKEPEVVFKKMTPKRHSRTESVSISKLSDLQLDIEPTKPTKQEFQMIVTEAEEVDRSDKDELSDKISSESSREIEISERKSSEGISDKISSEDAVTEKKTSSEEDALKDGEALLVEDKVPVTAVKELAKEVEKTDVKVVREDTVEKGKIFFVSKIFQNSVPITEAYLLSILISAFPSFPFNCTIFVKIAMYKKYQLKKYFKQKCIVDRNE